MGEQIGDREALVAFDPHWCLFWGDSISGAHLKIWLPYLRRSRFRFVLMCRRNEVSRYVLDKVAGVPNCAVIQQYPEARSWLHAAPDMRGVLYVTTRAENFVMTTDSSLAHVWIGHGESEKGTSGPKAGGLYDSVVTARYSALRRFPPYVWPWVAHGILAIGAPIVEGVVKDPRRGPQPIRTILYAPTFEGYADRLNYSSLPQVVPLLVAAMPALHERGITVIVRPHPATGIRLPAYRDLVAALHEAGVRKAGAKPADFAAADLLISDVSGVTSEYLFTEKPQALAVTEDIHGRMQRGKDPFAGYPWAYKWDVSHQGVLDLIDGLEASDPLCVVREKMSREMFRGHQSLDEAAETFDAALAAVRRLPHIVPTWLPFEIRRRRRPGPRPSAPAATGRLG